MKLAVDRVVEAEVACRAPILSAMLIETWLMSESRWRLWTPPDVHQEVPVKNQKPFAVAPAVLSGY